MQAAHTSLLRYAILVQPGESISKLLNAQPEKGHGQSACKAVVIALLRELCDASLTNASSPAGQHQQRNPSAM